MAIISLKTPSASSNPLPAPGQVSRKLLRYALMGGSLFLTIVPIYRLFSYLQVNVQNNLSVDDVMIAPLIGRILGGSYPWSQIFQDTFINGHFQILPILAQVG